MKISIKNLVLALSWVYSINQQRALGISYKCGEKNIGAVYLTVNEVYTTCADDVTVQTQSFFKLLIFPTQETVLTYTGQLGRESDWAKVKSNFPKPSETFKPEGYIRTPKSLSGDIKDLSEEIRLMQVPQDPSGGLKSILETDSQAITEAIIAFVEKNELQDLPANWQMGVWIEDCENRIEIRTFLKQNMISYSDLLKRDNIDIGTMYYRNGERIELFGDFNKLWKWDEPVKEATVEIGIMQFIEAHNKRSKLCLTIQFQFEEQLKNKFPELWEQLKKNIQSLEKNAKPITLSYSFDSIDRLLWLIGKPFEMMLLFYLINDEQILRQYPGKHSFKKVQVVDQDTHKCEAELIKLDNPLAKHQLLILEGTIYKQVFYIGLRYVNGRLRYKVTEDVASCEELTDYKYDKDFRDVILNCITTIAKLIYGDTYEAYCYRIKNKLDSILKPMVLFELKMPINPTNYPEIVKFNNATYKAQSVEGSRAPQSNRQTAHPPQGEISADSSPQADSRSSGAPLPASTPPQINTPSSRQTAHPPREPSDGSAPQVDGTPTSTLSTPKTQSILYIIALLVVSLFFILGLMHAFNNHKPSERKKISKTGKPVLRKPLQSAPVRT